MQNSLGESHFGSVICTLLANSCGFFSAFWVCFVSLPRKLGCVQRFELHCCSRTQLSFLSALASPPVAID